MNVSLRKFAHEITFHNKVSLGSALLIDSISNVQTICLILITAFNGEDTSTGYLKTFLKAISYYFIEITSTPSRQPLIILTISGYFALNISLIIASFLLDNLNRKTLKKKLLRVLAILYLLHSRILFLFIHYFLLQTINFQTTCGDPNDTLKCARVWLTLAYMICPLNIGLALIQELLFYSITKNKNSYAVKNNNFHQIVLFQKFVITFLDTLINDPSLQAQIASVTNFILTTLVLIVLYKKLPFYNMRLLKESIISTTIALTTSLISLLGVLGFSQNALEVFWIFLSFFAVKASFACLNNLFYQILQGKFNSPEKAIHFLILLKESEFGYVPPFLFEKKLSLRSMAINGTFYDKSFNIERMKIVKTRGEYEKNMYIQGILYVEKTLERYPNSELLLLFMANMYLKRLKNIPKAILLLKRCKSLNKSLYVESSIEDFKSKLKRVYNTEFLFDRDQDTLNVINYFRCRANTMAIKDNMLKEVEGHMEFWEELQKEEIDIKTVVEIIKKIGFCSNLILNKNKSYENYCEDYFSNSIILFGIYLEIIKENVKDAKQLIQKFTNLNHSPLDYPFDLYSDREAVVVVPLEKDRFGRIVDASGSAQELFGMTKQQIISKPLGIILPSIITDHIFKLIDNCLSVVSEKMSYNMISYAKINNGNMFEAEVDIHFYPEIEKEIKLMLFFKKISSPGLIMIISPDGTIVEAAEALKKVLHLPTNYSSSIKLQDILYDYERLETISTTNHLNSTKVLDNNISDGISRNMMSKGKHENNELNSESPEANKAVSLHDDVQNKQVSFNQTGKRLTEFEKKRYLFNFIPFKSTDKGTQITFDVDIKTNVIEQQTYKILTLVQNYDKEERPSTTNGEVSNNDETKSYPEAKGQVATSKTSHSKVAEKLQKGQTFVPTVKKKSNWNEKVLSTKKKHPEREMSISSSSSRKLMSVRNLNSLFDGISMSSFKKINIAIFLIIIFLVCLGAVNLFLSQKSLTDIQSGINIVNFTGLRLLKSMKAWQLATRAFLRYYKLRTSTQLPALKTSMYQEGLGMAQVNKGLSQEIASQVIDDLFPEFYKRDVRLWELYENRIFTDDNTDTFVATNLISGKMVFIANTTINFELPIVKDAIRYVINVTGNDFLISSENLLSVTQNVLQVIINDNILNLKIMLWAENVAMVVLCLSLMFLAKKVLKSYRSLFKALVKVENHQIENRLGYLFRLKDFLNQDIETKQFGRDGLDIFRSSLKDDFKKQTHDVNISNRREPKLSFRDMNFYLAKIIGISLITAQITTALFIFSLAQSLSNFQDFERVNNQLYTTTKSGYSMTTIIGIFYTEMLFRNETSMLVRNEPPARQVISTLEELREINNELKYLFYGSGTIDPFIRELLEDRVCKYLSKSVQDYCKASSQIGNTEIGILGLNSKVIAAEEYYSNLYFSNPTYDNAKKFIDNYVAAMRPSADTLEESYYVLNNYIIENFYQLKEDCLKRTKYLYLGILVSLAISWSMIQGLSIRKLKSLDYCRGQILKAISCKILLENKAMKSYLNKKLRTRIV